jgi:hypothetical protein
LQVWRVNFECARAWDVMIAMPKNVTGLSARSQIVMRPERPDEG